MPKKKYFTKEQINPVFGDSQLAKKKGLIF